MSIFGQVWVFSAIAFVLGAFLAWLFLVRPARKRIRELERRLAASESAAPAPQANMREPEFAGTRAAVAPSGFDDPDPVAAPSRQETSGTRQFEPAQDLPATELTQQFSPATDWPERDSLAGLRESSSQFPPEQPRQDTGGFASVLDDGPSPVRDEEHEQVEESPLTDLFGGTSAPRHGLREPDDGSPFTSQPDLPSRTAPEAEQPEEPEPAQEAARSDSDGTTDDGTVEALGTLDADDADVADTADEPATAFHEPVAAQPAQRPGSLFQPIEYDAEPEPGFDEPEPEAEQPEQLSEEDSPPAYAFGGPDARPDDEAAVEQTQILPKRQPRQSPAGGFDPPQPIQPSMRPVARREPEQDGATHSGSLFEPSVAPGAGAARVADHGLADDVEGAPEPSAAEDADPQGDIPPARDESYERGALPPGPFGPGSAMPKPGGGKPSEDFTVKASVTALRYCTDESPQYGRMVAEVWFRSSADAERVGFRPLS